MTGPRFAVSAALVAGLLALASPASGAIGDDTPPEGGFRTAAATPGTGPVSVAVVMPLTVPPTTTGLLDADALSTYTRSGGLLDRQLDAVAGTVAAIGIDPMITASIQVLGSSAPPEALAFLTRLRGVSNEIFLLGYADADPALAVVAGTGDELSPLGFGSVIDPANFGPAATATPTAGATVEPTPAATTAPDGSPPPLPTTEDLLAWATTLPPIAWPAEGTVTEEGLGGLGDLGYEDVLLGSGNVSPTSTALVGLGDLGGLVVDDELSEAVRDAVYAPNDTEYRAAIVTMAAALRADAITSPGRTFIATLDRRWPFGTPRLAAVLSAIEAESSSRLVTLGAVLEGPEGSATLVPPAGDLDAVRVQTVGALATAARNESAYLSIASAPTTLTEPRRLTLLALSAVGWRLDAVGWDAATTDALHSARATLDAVQITEGSDQLVLSDISSLRVHVSNALPVTVTVYVVVRPLRPLLTVENPSVEVTLEPDSTTAVSVPVQSIANGDVTVRAELQDSGGRTLGAARFLNVILQAGWETVGTLVAGALVLGIFGVGLVRVILRRRRGESVDDDTDDDADDDAAHDSDDTVADD